MEKEEKNYIILIIVILGFLFMFFIINFYQTQPTGKVVEKPLLPENCSNESIKTLWENIFKGSSENLTITTMYDLYGELYNETNNTEELEDAMYELFGCPIYSIYQTDGNNLRMLFGASMWFLFDMKMVIAYVGEFTPGTIENLTNTSDSYYTTEALNSQDGLVFGEEFIQNYIIPRKVKNITEAQMHFESLFNISSSNWYKEYLTVIEENMTVYLFLENETMENITLFGETIDPQGIYLKIGMVFQNYSLDTYMFSQVSVFGDLYKQYENWTSPINTSIENISVEINGSKVKMSEELELFSEPRSGAQKLEILENNKTIVETEINFSEEIGFDFTEIILKKQEDSSNAGYLIINGLNATKTVRADRLNNNSESVCIKDLEVNEISEISSDCNSTNESLVECPGSLGNFTCAISGTKFIITGLTHSAILEMLPPQEPCNPHWECDDWSNYEELCGYRTCIDLNSCDNLTGKPLEYKQCPECVPDWDCTEWTPEKCPKSEERTRTCTDLNDCGTTKNRPSLKQSCERKNNLIWILIGVVGGIIIIFIIIMIMKKEKNEMYPGPDQLGPPLPPPTQPPGQTPQQGYPHDTPKQNSQPINMQQTPPYPQRQGYMGQDYKKDPRLGQRPQGFNVQMKYRQNRKNMQNQRQNQNPNRGFPPSPPNSRNNQQNKNIP